MPRRTLIGHFEIDPVDRPNCPGPNVDWNKTATEANASLLSRVVPQARTVHIYGTTPLTLGLDATFAFWVRPDTYGTLDPSPGNYTLNHGRILRKGTFLDIYGIDDPGLKARLDRTLNEGLQRLEARQTYDGGWPWWQETDPDPYITTYVLFGLFRALASLAPE